MSGELTPCPQSDRMERSPDRPVGGDVEQHRAGMVEEQFRPRTRPARACPPGRPSPPRARAMSTKPISGWTGRMSCRAPGCVRCSRSVQYCSMLSLSSWYRRLLQTTNFGVDAVAGRGPQRLDRVHAAAVAGEADHRLVRVGQLHADRAGDADARATRRGSGSSGPAAWRQVRDQLRRGGQRLVEHHQVRRAPAGRARARNGSDQACRVVGRRGRLGSAAALIAALGGRGAVRPGAQPAAAASASAASVSFGSATRPRSTGRFLAISYASRSMWTTCASGRGRRRQGREDLGEHVRADDQDRVGVGDDRGALSAPNMWPSRPRVQRVVGRMLHLGRVDAPDVGAQQLGHPGQLGLRRPDTETPSPTRISGRCGPGQQRGGLRRPVPARAATRVSGIEVGTTGSSLGASSTSIGRATKTGPMRRRRRHLDGPAQHPQQRARVDHPGRPLGHRPGHGDQVGRHLRVHGVVARCRTRRRSPPAARGRAWPGRSCRCRCRGPRRCGAGPAPALAGRPGVAVGDRRPRPSPAASRMYWKPGTPRARRGSPARRCPGCRTCA